MSLQYLKSAKYLKHGSSNLSEFQLRAFFAEGEAVGASWSQLYFAEFYSDLCLASFSDEEITALRWLLLFIIMRNDAGHIRIDISDERLKLESGWWLPEKNGSDLLNEILKVKHKLFICDNLIGDLASTIDKPLLLSSDLDYIYLNRRKKKENELLDSIRSKINSSPKKLSLSKRIEANVVEIANLLDIEISNEILSLAKILSSKSFSILTGGPGTGKTSALALILLSIKDLDRDGLKIKLAAPTGRAAQRIVESLQNFEQKLSQRRGELFFEENKSDSFKASTIHRLLGSLKRGGFRYNIENPIDADIVVIDEASMVDLSLMVSLLKAIPNDCRLLLVGDSEQLPSVEAGALLGDFISGADNPKHLLNKSVVTLKQFYRSDSHIRDLTSLIIDEKYNDFISQLNREDRLWQNKLVIPSEMDNFLKELYANIPGEFDSGFNISFNQHILVHEIIEKWLSYYEQFAILTPTRRGLYGVESINRRAQRIFGNSKNSFHGQPIMINRNDYDKNLFNGDKGVVISFKEGDWVFFREGDGLRSVMAAHIENRESAFAITVHKSQGAEFEKVILFMPDGVERVISREILYTGMTRAKKELKLIGEEVTIRKALLRTIQRDSAIRDSLGK